MLEKSGTREEVSTNHVKQKLILYYLVINQEYIKTDEIKRIKKRRIIE